MGHAQQFAKVSIERLVLSLVPLCYLNYGLMGFWLAVGAAIYMRLQIKTFGVLSQRMRNAYDEGFASGRPVIDDVNDVPSSCRAPHTEGMIGLLTAQLFGTVAFALR